MIHNVSKKKEPLSGTEVLALIDELDKIDAVNQSDDESSNSDTEEPTVAPVINCVMQERTIDIGLNHTLHMPHIPADISHYGNPQSGDSESDDPNDETYSPDYSELDESDLGGKISHDETIQHQLNRRPNNLTPQASTSID